MKLNAYQRAVPSPDGTLLILVTSNEVRMSHWIDFAQLVEAATGRVLAEVGGSSWSADDIAWSPDGAHVELQVRHYPGDASLRLRLFPPAQRAELDLPGGVVERVPLDGVAAAMEAFARQTKKDLWGRSGPHEGGPLDEATVTAFKAKAEALLREGKVSMGGPPPRLEDLVQEIPIAPGPRVSPDTKAWLLVLKSGACLRYEFSGVSSYFSQRLW